jgi:cytochrome d ubiquinol oxidase subunit I
VLGLIATRSIDTPVEGIKPLVAHAREQIENGLLAYKWLAAQGEAPAAGVPKALETPMSNLGHALLLKRIRPDIENATPSQIQEAAESTIPDVPVLFWSFRVMVALGFYFIAVFTAAFYLSWRRRLNTPWFLRIAVISLPLPWIAAELGCIVAEYGRQPWVIDGVMPTFVGVSNVPATNVLLSLLGFLAFYTTLALVDLLLIVKYVRLGPEPDEETLHRLAASPVSAH